MADAKNEEEAQEVGVATKLKYQAETLKLAPMDNGVEIDAKDTQRTLAIAIKVSRLLISSFKLYSYPLTWLSNPELSCIVGTFSTTIRKFYTTFA